MLLFLTTYLALVFKPIEVMIVKACIKCGQDCRGRCNWGMKVAERMMESGDVHARETNGIFVFNNLMERSYWFFGLAFSYQQRIIQSAKMIFT